MLGGTKQLIPLRAFTGFAFHEFRVLARPELEGLDKQMVVLYVYHKYKEA